MVALLLSATAVLANDIVITGGRVIDPETALPVNAPAQSTDLTGLAGSPRLSFAPQVTQGPASDLDPEYLSPAPSLDPDALLEAELLSPAPSLDPAALSKQLSNPNSPLSTLVFKHTYTQFDGTLPGASDQSSNVSIFQPVFPFPIGDGTNLFIRPGIAYVWDQPVFDPNSGNWDSVSGWADVGFDIAVGQTLDGGWVAVGGVQGTIPTYSDVSGEQWRLGPEALVANIGEKAYGALFPSHQWDINGDYDYSTSGLEIFAGYFLPNAWTIYTNSQLTYDWVADQATVPINLTLRKVTKIGNTPIQFNLGVDYFVESNDEFGQDWAIKFSMAPVVENFIYDAFRR